MIKIGKLNHSYEPVKGIQIGEKFTLATSSYFGPFIAYRGKFLWIVPTFKEKRLRLARGCRQIADRSFEIGYASLCLAGFRWVNLYSVTREYGGPEEGGWWFDATWPVKSRLVWKPFIKSTFEKFKSEAETRTHGRYDQFSADPNTLDDTQDYDENDMTGCYSNGEKFIARIERQPANEPVRPHYD